MLQRHTILINESYSANTATTLTASASTLTTVGGYQINNVQGLGGGITNPSNVRGFLNDNTNDIIINDFFSYLTASTTTAEFSEIYHSDKKLSDVFNNYYNSSIVNGQIPSTSVIDETITGTVGTTIIENSIYNYNGVAPIKGLENTPLSINGGDRLLNTYSALTTVTSEQSYYIPVFIKRNNKQMARFKFDACNEIINLILNQESSNFDANKFAQPLPKIVTPQPKPTTEVTKTPSNIIVGPFTIIL